jgi:hypothetical protein
MHILTEDQYQLEMEPMTLQFCLLTILSLVEFSI